MTIQLTRCFALAAVLAAAPAEDRDPGAAAFSKALSGDWQGTLEYRDYSTDKRVSLPTTLEARPADEGRAATWKFRYDEGKGRFVESTSTLRVDSKKNTLSWESDEGRSKTEYSLTGLDAFGKARRCELVLSGPGTENREPVEVRQTITLDGDELEVLRESRKPGGVFAFRNQYRLKRTPPPGSETKPEVRPRTGG